MNATLAQVAAELHARDDFLVVTHMRPDADATGSQLALGAALENAGKKVTYWSSDPVPEKFFFLPGWRKVVVPLQEASFQTVVSVDCASFERLGRMRHLIARLRKDPAQGPEPFFVNLDHHVSNTLFADLNCMDFSSPASGQIVYELLGEAGFPLTLDIATCLYAAISTDTGSFQYPNTTSKTMRVVAELMETGLKVGQLNQFIYESFPLRRLKLLKEVLATVSFEDGDRVAWFKITREMYVRSGAKPEDNENFIDVIRSVRPVMVAILFEEEEGGLVRLSLRSKDPQVVDVNGVAQQFGGGGHAAAAGARPSGTLDEIIPRVLAAVSDRLKG
ncbi:MAG: bifunctional oligoribonuclease/PAP phosphatase NrnA [Verrucomicrobiae bacterium]|nr:bifunctional oligoribonuclease/PAP phosphatase NrnA [Verrucomicrobiae bacterium]